MERNIIATPTRLRLRTEIQTTHCGHGNGPTSCIGYKLITNDGVWSSIYLDRQSRRGREFVVDSGASKHMMSKMELSPEELETVKVSRLRTTVAMANGSIDAIEEA